MLKLNPVFNSNSLIQVLNKLNDSLEIEPILDESLALILNRIRTRFLAETDPEGTPWKPSKAGLRRRAKGGSGTLFDTGRLFRSIQASATPATRVISTDVPYAKKNQLGLDNTTPRVFLGFSDADAQLVEKLILLRVSKVKG